jgi:uncharacterized membrane protein YidH (DUF202 family)
VGVGVGRVIPEHHWAEQVLGAAFCVLGIGLVWIGYARLRAVEDALDHGGFAKVDARLPLVLLAAGVLLGVAVILVVVFG